MPLLLFFVFVHYHYVMRGKQRWVWSNGHDQILLVVKLQISVAEKCDSVTVSTP